MSATYEGMSPGGHEAYATSIFSKIKTYLDSNPYGPVKDIPNTPIAIASFDDGSALPMPSLKVAIEPQQDLHGYDAPWVGGAGKNKFSGASYLAYMTETNGTFSNSNTDTQTKFRFAVQAFDANGYMSGSSQVDITTPGRYYITMTFNSAPTFLRIKHNGSQKDLSIDTPFTEIGTFTISLNVTKTDPSTVGGLEFKDVQIESGSQMTSYAPYSNICPISGWSECNLRISGEQYVTFPIFTSGKSINSDGVVQKSPTRSATIDSVPCNENTQYTIESNGNERIGIFYYKSDDSFISFDTWGYMPRTFTTPSECAFIRFSYYTATPPTYTVVYETVGASSYTIDLDGTRYGGTLDVVSGVLTVDRAYVDLGTLHWSYASAQKLFYDNLPTNALNVTNKNGLCEGYKPTAQQSMDSATWSRISNGEFVFAQNLKTSGRCAVAIKNLNYTDTTEFKSSVNGMKMLYPLATPQTYQLTPTQVNSLLGINNVWADTGDILDAEYIRDKYDNITAKYAAYAYNSGNADTATSATTASKLGSSNVGSATQPIYLNGGTATACTYTLGKSVPSDAVFTDTKNTAGSTDTSSKIFLIGATSQAANPQTYSQDTAYVGTDGCLYSGGTKVLTAHQDISGKADKSATVSTVAWSNNKLTKTINGTTSDVVSAATILDNLTSSQVTTALGYVPGPSYEFESSDDSINISASMVPGSETIDLKLNSVSWNNISGKPSTFAPSVHDHNYLVSAGTNTQSTSSTAYALGTFNVRWFNATGKLPGQPAQHGFLLTTATGTSSVENHQIFVEQPNGNLYHRGTNGSTSSSPPAFKTILDSSNYTSYTRNSSGVIKVKSVTKTPTNAGTSLASPTPIIDSGYKFLCWLYVQSNGYIVGANHPGGAANPSATWWFANGYLANYALTFYYLEIKDTI